jgi:hypothetical protein
VKARSLLIGVKSRCFWWWGAVWLLASQHLVDGVVVGADVLEELRRRLACEAIARSVL